MARKTTDTEKAAEILDRFTNEIDVNMLLCGALGGLAAYGGIVPPFTRLLMLMSGATAIPSELSNLIKTDYEKAQVVVTALGSGALMGGFAGTLIGLFVKRQLEDGGMPAEQAEIKAGEITTTATFCSGALEGMLMYKAMSNTEIMKSVIAMPGQILKGIGEIVPG